MSLLSSLEIEEIVSKNKPSSSAFIFRHLPLTTGITLGNFFRRILLNHISGIAIVGAEIADKNGPLKTKVDASWEGIDKPIPWYLIVKLKEVVFVEKEAREGIFRVEMVVENNTKKERIITAGDFSEVREVEIKNPELELTTLSSGGKLNLKLYCQKSWGYQEKKEKKDREEMKKAIKEYFPNEEDNIIAFDTNYSPVKLVNSQVDKVIVDLTKEEEKLTLTIDTNGAIEPRQALQEALEISQQSFRHISQLISDNSINKKRKREELEPKPTAEKVKRIKILK